jgi:hypothetical protein
MIFSYNDAWLLQAILHSEGQEGASLINIVAYADYANHAVMTYEEFSGSLSRLMFAGIVLFDKPFLRTSEAFRAWRTEKYKGKKRFGILKEIDVFEKYLNKTFSGITQGASIIEIAREQFQEAVEEYIHPPIK